MNQKKLVVIGFLGATLDAGKGPGRWEKWRPSVALCQHDNLLVDRFELLFQEKFTELGQVVLEDIATVSPETQVELKLVNFQDPWDFEEVYAVLFEWVRGYEFDVDREEYLIHITTGTHVAQICLFLLTESHHFPGKLLQTAPPKRYRGDDPGTFTIIDLDLSKYGRIASRFAQEQQESLTFLKSGIETRDPAFNKLIEQIEKVAIASKAPMLLMGPTGAGKSRLAKRIYELKRARHVLEGRFVEVNCATLRGDTAMSTLFGHVKGAFTGAVNNRPGLLRQANHGLLFLDEIGELGLDEQAMLLRALEDKTFLPMGADHETDSDFQLIAGTNRDLHRSVAEGKFREDLLARINLWTFHLPGLKDRRADIEPNIAYELDEFARRNGSQIVFTNEARRQFLKFALSAEAVWSGNFRDLNAAVTRMATLAEGGRVTPEDVADEIKRLTRSWQGSGEPVQRGGLEQVLEPEQMAALDRFDRVQLADVVAVCRTAATLSEAGRLLFSTSRERKKNTNDADRLRKYLARFGLSWNSVKGP